MKDDFFDKMKNYISSIIQKFIETFLLKNLGENDNLKKYFDMKPTKQEKEMRSFKNKFHGSNLIWFESLVKPKQEKLLKDWKRYKWYKRNNNNEVKYFKTWDWNNNKTEMLRVINYKPSFKHFINEKKKMRFYKVSTQIMRDNIIDHLLK